MTVTSRRNRREKKLALHLLLKLSLVRCRQLGSTCKASRFKQELVFAVHADKNLGSSEPSRPKGMCVHVDVLMTKTCVHRSPGSKSPRYQQEQVGLIDDVVR